MRRAAILLPPLRLSQHFIDYPYLVGIGAYQAAATLRQCGWDARVVDGLARASADLLREDDTCWLGEPSGDYLSRLDGIEADRLLLIGSPFLLAPPARSWLRELTARAKQPVVIAEMFVGGMHYLEVEPEEILQLPNIQMLLRYEGEQLLTRLDAEKRLSLSSAGVREEHEPFSLKDLPAPAYDLLDAEAFFRFLRRVLSSRWRAAPFPAEPIRTLPLITARGCPFECIFCTTNPGLRGTRAHRTVPIERVDGWLAEWKERFDLERVVLLDELANLDTVRFNGLLDIFERYQLRVEIPNGLRADRVTEDQVARLAKMTSAVKVSLESASVRVQNEILHKRLDPNTVERVAQWCHKHNAPLQIHCMIGIPGETQAEARQTIGMAVELAQQYGAEPLVQYATPLPGTRLHQICGEQDLLPEASADLMRGFQHQSVIDSSDFLVGAKQVVAQKRERQRKVIVNLTYQCNNHCVFCAVGDRSPTHAEQQPVIEALKNYRAQGYELLDLDGGEPTLHPQLFNIIAEARSLGFSRITVVTNGRRSSYRAYAEQLARCGVHEVLVSLHAGTAALHEQLTSSPGSFEQTVEGLRNLTPLIPVGVNTTVVAQNIAALRPLGELVADAGAKRWTLQVVTPFGRATPSQLPSEEALREHLSALLDNPPNLTVQLINCPPCFVPGYEQLALSDFDKAARDMVFVGASGENLQGYLSQRRQHTDRCEGCIYAVICPGEYSFE